MTLKTWIYKFTLRTKNIRISRKLSNVCNLCNIPIEIGDEIYSRNSNSRKSKSKIYHLDCAHKVNIL